MHETEQLKAMYPVGRCHCHGMSPIPQEGRFGEVREVGEISGFIHSVGTCALKQGACKLTLNVKEGGDPGGPGGDHRLLRDDAPQQRSLHRRQYLPGQHLSHTALRGGLHFQKNWISALHRVDRRQPLRRCDTDAFIRSASHGRPGGLCVASARNRWGDRDVPPPGHQMKLLVHQLNSG